MAQLLRKQCPWCAKAFFTYEKDKEFCNTECKGKSEYKKEFPSSHIKQPKADGICVQCGLSSNGKSMYCSHACKMLAQRKPESQKKPPKRNNPLPYEVLNKIAEKKRVMDEKFAEIYVRQGGYRER